MLFYKKTKLKKKTTFHLGGGYNQQSLRIHEIYRPNHKITVKIAPTQVCYFISMGFGFLLREQVVLRGHSVQCEVITQVLVMALTLTE